MPGERALLEELGVKQVNSSAGEAQDHRAKWPSKGGPAGVSASRAGRPPSLEAEVPPGWKPHQVQRPGAETKRV